MWWADLGRWPAAHPAPLALPVPSSLGRGEKVGWKSLWLKSGGSFTSYHRRCNSLDWRTKIKVALEGEKQRRELTHPCPSIPFAGLSCAPSFPIPLLPPEPRGDGGPQREQSLSFSPLLPPRPVLLLPRRLQPGLSGAPHRPSGPVPASHGSSSRGFLSAVPNFRCCPVMELPPAPQGHGQVLPQVLCTTGPSQPGPVECPRIGTEGEGDTQGQSELPVTGSWN